MAVSYDQIPPQETFWLWRDRIPMGDAVLFYGDGSVGKGRMLCSLIASVTRGEPVGTDSEAGEPGDVVVVFPEDKPGEQVRKRLDAAGADLTRVHDMTRLDGGGRLKLSASPRHVGHLPLLRAFIGELKQQGRNPRMLIIDPIAAVLGAGWGTIITNAGARQLVEPLQDMADETGIAAVLVAHTVKDGQLQGSAGLSQALRYVYKVERDPANDAQRIVSAVKANNVPPMDDLRFTIADGPDGFPRVVWLNRAAVEARRQEWRDELADRRQARSAPTAPKVIRWTALASTGGGAVKLAENIPSDSRARMICELSPAGKALEAAGIPFGWHQDADGNWRGGNSRFALAVVPVAG